MEENRDLHTIEHDISINDSLQTFRPFANPDYPIEILQLQISMLSMYMVRWHWHEELEIIAVQSGEAWIKTEEANVVLRTGQGIILNQNLLHSIRIAHGDDCVVNSMRIHPAFLFGYQNNTLASKYMTPVVASPYFKYFVLDSRQSHEAEMLGLVDQMLLLDEEKKFGYELEMKGCFSRFWYLLLSQVVALSPPDRSQSTSNFDGSRIKMAIRFIEKHYYETLSLEEIALSIHISKSECCRCFKRTLGITPFEYLLKYRVFESARKMQKKEAVAETIADLAASVGFNSPSYYNKVFRKYMNCTPLEYKRKILCLHPSGNLEENFLLQSGPTALTAEKPQDYSLKNS